jgi:hypothetical protein
MGGKITLLKELRPSVGVKAFVVHVNAQPRMDPKDSLFDIVEMESIEALAIDVVKSKILIYEDQVYSQIALEHILFNELKLKNRISFYNSGSTMAGAIRTLFSE